jgi:hypothetical protein
MTITVTITIDAIDQKDANKGCRVSMVSKFSLPAIQLPPSEGAVWVGIGNAINQYQREHGALDFDCFKAMGFVS